MKSTALNLNYEIDKYGTIITEDAVKYYYPERVIMKTYSDSTRKLVHQVKNIFDGTVVSKKALVENGILFEDITH